MSYKHKYGLGETGNGTGNYTPVSSDIPTEKVIQRKIVRAIEREYRKEVMVVKIHGGGYQRAGIPDLYVAVKGVSIWIEVKRRGADTTKLQQRFLKKLINQGVLCGTACDVKTALNLIKDALKSN